MKVELAAAQRKMTDQLQKYKDTLDAKDIELKNWFVAENLNDWNSWVWTFILVVTVEIRMVLVPSVIVKLENIVERSRRKIHRREKILKVEKNSQHAYNTHSTDNVCSDYGWIQVYIRGFILYKHEPLRRVYQALEVLCGINFDSSKCCPKFS